MIESIVSEIPQQPPPITSEIATETVVSETKTTIITTESEPPSNTSTHTVSDTSLVSEDKPILAMPLHFAKPEPTPEASYALMIEASDGENLPETQQENSTHMTLASYDNIVAMEIS